MSSPDPYSANWQPRRNNNNDWKRKIQDRWSSRIDQLFGNPTPGRAKWTDTDAIGNVIDKIAEPEGPDEQTHAWLNYPDSGDEGFYGASVHRDDGCVILETSPDQGAGTLLRPQYLEFNLPNNDERLAYFWLETQGLNPSGVYDDRSDKIFEEVCEVRPGDYEKRSVYDEGRITKPDGTTAPLPSTARPVMRYFEGSFLVSCKSSPYLQNAPVGKPTPDNGMHADMGPGDFREFMEWLSQKA